ncbi:hypothetical protein Tco_0927809 [Tanacetum coccineum]
MMTEDNTIAITTRFTIEKPDNSLSNGGRALDTIPSNGNGRSNKSQCLRILVPIPSESEEERSSGSPTTHSELSLPDYKAFYVDNKHFKERSSGSTTTHVDFSQYDSFIFDLSNNQFPPPDRSDLYHEEFADELTHIMSLPNLECFKFKIEPDPGDLTSIDLGIRKNASTTNVNVPLEDDQSSLFTLIVYGSFLLFSLPCPPPDLLSTGIRCGHFLIPCMFHLSFLLCRCISSGVKLS